MASHEAVRIRKSLLSADLVKPKNFVLVFAAAPAPSCEERSNEAIFFSQEYNLQAKLIRRKAPLFVCTKTGSLCTHIAFIGSCTHALKSAPVVNRLSSFALAKLGRFAR